MNKDFTDDIRQIDTLQERIDEVFHRVNADPAFTNEKTLADAISDNMRFFDEDRKNEYAEILFSILDLIYAKIVAQDTETPFCNPMCSDYKENSRFPEMEMLMRISMPLGWALSAKWEAEQLKNTMSDYLESFSIQENQLVRDILNFIFKCFDEYKEKYADCIEYWNKMADDRENMRPENDEDKSLLLEVMLEKRNKHIVDKK